MLLYPVLNKQLKPPIAGVVPSMMLLVSENGFVYAPGNMEPATNIDLNAYPDITTSSPYNIIVHEIEKRDFDSLHIYISERWPTTYEELYNLMYISSQITMSDMANALQCRKYTAKELINKLMNHHAIVRYHTVWKRTVAWTHWLYQSGFIKE